MIALVVGFGGVGLGALLTRRNPASEEPKSRYHLRADCGRAGHAAERQPYRPSRSLRCPARCLSNERPDDLARPLALVVRDPLQRRRIVYVKRHLNDEATVAGSLHDLHIGRAQFSELLIEVTGQRVGFRMRHDLSKIIRSARVESQPVMSSHVVRSMVSSMTSVRMRPASVRPIKSLRASRWGRSGLPRRFLITTCRFHSVCPASPVDIPRAPSLSSAVSVASNCVTSSGA